MMRIRDGKNSDPGSGMEKSRIRTPEKTSRIRNTGRLPVLWFTCCDDIMPLSLLFSSLRWLFLSSHSLMWLIVTSQMSLTWLWSPIIPFKGSFSTIVPLCGSSSLPIPLRVSISSLFHGYSLDILCCSLFIHSCFSQPFSTSPSVLL